MKIKLAEILATIAVALLKLAIQYGARPPHMEDVKTPSDIHARWVTWITQRLRDQGVYH